MRKIITLLAYVSIGFSAFSQAGWNWPEDETLNAATKEKQAYYKVLMQTDKYQEALATVTWLYKNTPNLHESIYQDGSKIIDELLELPGLSESRQTALEDSLLWTYDMRMKYFNNKASVLDRKAYTAFKLYYRNATRYPMLSAMYKELYTMNAADISDFNLTPYMTLATYYYKQKPAEFSATDVLDTHGKITAVIDEKVLQGGNREKLQKEQDKIDAFLSSLGDLISCEFIEEQLVPKFKSSPQDLNLAKKIFSYSLSARCTDKPYFISAGEVFFQSAPSYSLAKALADKYYFAPKYDKAMYYYQQMEDLAQDNEQKFDALMGQASTEVKLGNKKKARSVAYEALSVKPGASAAFNLIGNLYFLSFDECRGGESKVKDRAVYLAAYEMYQKAGNTEQMNACREQFPSIEDIFNESKEEGSKITVDCWINESVTLQRRQ
ncbi:tetratricopeptide repeat protein [Marinoscillum sp.]|uniref:tetratricopeptide repeat protein n=1 Tax=Marinoscillum sp. TaxID=2024838 RepID=UPI003BA844EF